MKGFLSLKRYFVRYRHRLIIAVIVLAITNAFALVVPWILKYTIDSLREVGDPVILLKYASLILVVSVIQGVLRYFSRNTFFRIARRIEYSLRKDFFAQLQRLPLSYLDKTRTGDLVSRGTNDLSVVWLSFGPALFHLLNTMFVYAIALAFMMAINPGLVLFALIPYPLLALATMLYGRSAHPRFQEVQRLLSSIASKIQENISGIRVVKAYVQEEAEIKDFRERCRAYLEENLRVARLSNLYHSLFGIMAGLGIVIVILLGGRAVIAGGMTLGEFIAFNGYLAMLVFPTIAFGWIMSLFQRGAAAVGRINEVMALRPATREGPRDSGVGAQLPDGDIEFKDLSFSYPGQREVLRNINLKIPQGMTLGIVGPTGCGKSTLVHLIAKLYPVEEGRLLIGGRDINTIPTKLFRRSIGFVPQESFLFSESLKENIAYGEPGADEERIYEAASISRLIKDISQFPDRLDTLVGERGVTLSGGQRQRAALARAIMMDPRIFVLDEAVASVDAETEREIKANLSSFMKGRTCIIVSHRISAVKDADWIIVMDGGRIVEQGTHDHLMSRDGLYARLFKRQTIMEELERI